MIAILLSGCCPLHQSTLVLTDEQMRALPGVDLPTPTFVHVPAVQGGGTIVIQNPR